MHALLAIAAFLATCVGLVVLTGAILVVLPFVLVCWFVAWLFGNGEDESGGEG